MSHAETLLFERYDEWMVLVHGTRAPANGEWEPYVRALHEADAHGGRGLLVMTDGVGPDAAQRKMVADIKMRTAVVTRSRVARGIVTALGWLGVSIRAFPPELLEEAYEFLSVPVPRRTALSRRLLEMRLSLMGNDASEVAVMASGELAGRLNRRLDDRGA